MGWARDADHENTLDWAVNEATTVINFSHSYSYSRSRRLKSSGGAVTMFFAKRWDLLLEGHCLS